MSLSAVSSLLSPGRGGHGKKREEHALSCRGSPGWEDALRHHRAKASALTERERPVFDWPQPPMLWMLPKLESWKPSPTG